MRNILDTKKAIRIATKLRQEEKTIVLTGGCFDILHAGHVQFLTKAKEKGTVLFVMLESDQTVRKQKGNDRPINTQLIRAYLLANLLPVDFVILLPPFTSNRQYDELVFALKPAIIATTKKDPYIRHKIRQAQASGAQVCEVINRLTPVSTTKLAKLISEKDLYDI